MITRIQGTLTAADSKRHIPHTFDLPAGTAQLDIRFRYAMARRGRIENLLCLTLFDPTSWRGAGHRSGARQAIHLSEHRATPGYVAGPLPPGTWTLVIDAHQVQPNEPCPYVIELTASPEAEASEAGPALPAPRTSIARGPGWFRGDLHAHTVHSDAGWTVEALVAAAAARQLDFLALTDHNTVAGLDEFLRICPPQLLPIVGEELTTFWGHALSLGTRHWIDWRIQPGVRSMAHIAADVAAAGGLFVIAHPASIGDPYCTGCSWEYTDMAPGPARVVEVWNGAWANDDSGNEGSLQTWYHWLNQGHRLAATAGSDAHGPYYYRTRPGFNVVYAEVLTQEELLAAIARGRLYLSVGPHLELRGTNAAGEHAAMGEGLRGPGVELTASWDQAPRGASLRLIVDGVLREHREVDASGSHTWPIPSEAARWCVVELRDRQGRMAALTNPIYLEREGVDETGERAR